MGRAVLLWQKRVSKKDDMQEFRKVCRELDKLLDTKKGQNNGRTYHGIRAALSSRQQCIVKLRIGKDIKTHIKEYLPQEHKKDVTTKPDLYNGWHSGRSVP
jgi:hypothetical protein